MFVVNHQSYLVPFKLSCQYKPTKYKHNACTIVPTRYIPCVFAHEADARNRNANESDVPSQQVDSEINKNKHRFATVSFCQTQVTLYRTQRSVPCQAGYVDPCLSPNCRAHQRMCVAFESVYNTLFLAVSEYKKNSTTVCWGIRTSVQYRACQHFKRNQKGNTLVLTSQYACGPICFFSS